MKISEIRDVIRSGYYLRDMLTGGTSEEFARQEVGPAILERMGEISALDIPARFQADRIEANAELERCRAVVARWEIRRGEYLDTLTQEATKYPSFQALVDSEFTDGPELHSYNARHLFLAKRYNAAQEAKNSPRRAVMI